MEHLDAVLLEAAVLDADDLVAVAVVVEEAQADLLDEALAERRWMARSAIAAARFGLW